MLDFLVAVAQFVCFLGLLYGAFLWLAHGDSVDRLRSYYDPISGHDWLEQNRYAEKLEIRVVGITVDHAAPTTDRLTTAHSGSIDAPDERTLTQR